MPRKKKSNIGLNTRNARRKRLAIKNETDEQRVFRQSKERERLSLRRSRETSVEREQRLKRIRERKKLPYKDRELSKRKREKIPENLWSNEVNSEMNDNSSIEYKYEPVDSNTSTPTPTSLQSSTPYHEEYSHSPQPLSTFVVYEQNDDTLLSSPTMSEQYVGTGEDFDLSNIKYELSDEEQ